MRDLKPRDFVEIKIIDIMSEKDQSCPICKLINESMEKLIDTILYELVNDPQVRSNLRTMGLCRKHVEIIERYLHHHPELGLLGIAIIYEDILDHKLKTIKQNESDIYSCSCYLCNHESQLEEVYTSSFGKILSETDGMILFSQSDSVFCLYHFGKIYRLLNDTTKDRFKEIQTEKLNYLKDQLSIFIKKHDYRNKESIGKEATAYRSVGKLISQPTNLDNRRNHKWQFWRISRER
ncbi:DUF6062 family protein [Thermotoga profunda]|uniref:DUF6062 family protein n=1 Tax=Thermotoga profunda TaxID=1508420 RepID=UPI001494C65B|nr:DUF6062 family protein [Thermotoga profunda]